MSEFDGGGSDPVLVAEMAAFWDAYDALETNAEKAALQRDFLLAHGGKIMPPGRGWPWAEVVGGLYPVDHR